MNTQKTASALQSWPRHLNGLDDETLSRLACDYRWLTEENRVEEEGEEFRGRREAIVAECERRGKPELADVCRSPIASRKMSQPEQLG